MSRTSNILLTFIDSGGKGLKLEFYPEATELTYPCEADAVQEWDLSHEVDIPNRQNGTKSPVPAPRFSKQHATESNMSRDCDSSCDYDSIRFDQSYKISNLQKSYITPF